MSPMLQTAFALGLPGAAVVQNWFQEVRRLAGGAR
jgi:hypothetical protein